LNTLKSIDHNESYFVTASQDTVPLDESIQKVFDLFISEPTRLKDEQQEESQNNGLKEGLDDEFLTLQKNVILAMAK